MAPEGPVYQAGTLSGNPLAMAAGVETLERLDKPRVYDRLGDLSRRLVRGLQEIADDAGVEFVTQHLGGMFGFYFHPGPVRNFADAQAADEARFQRFYASMLDQGIYLAPSPYEAGFVSLAHRPADIDRTLEAAQHGHEEGGPALGGRGPGRSPSAGAAPRETPSLAAPRALGYRARRSGGSGSHPSLLFYQDIFLLPGPIRQGPPRQRRPGPTSATRKHSGWEVR